MQRDEAMSLRHVLDQCRLGWLEAWVGSAAAGDQQASRQSGVWSQPAPYLCKQLMERAEIGEVGGFARCGPEQTDTAGAVQARLQQTHAPGEAECLQRLLPGRCAAGVVRQHDPCLWTEQSGRNRRSSEREAKPVIPVRPAAIEAQENVVEHGVRARQVDAIGSSGEHGGLGDRPAIVAEHQPIQTVANREPPVCQSEQIEPDGRNQRGRLGLWPDLREPPREAGQILRRVGCDRSAVCAAGRLQQNQLAFSHALQAQGTCRTHCG